MAKAPLPFPSSAAELPKLSNADLIQLVKQEGVDHPQGKSLAHFMSKEDKVAYLGAQHYATGAEIAHVIPNAEAKYANFLAKAQASAAAKKASSGLGTNCSATAMKDLEAAVADLSSGGLHDLNIIHGDITSFFIDHPTLTEAPANAGVLQQFISQLKALPSAVQLGTEEEKVNALVEMLKTARNTIDDLPELAAKGDVVQTLKYAKQLDDIAPVFGTGSPIESGLNILSAQAKAQAEAKSIDYFIGTAPMKTYMSIGGGWTEQPLAELVSSLHDVATIDPAMLTEGVVKNADTLVSKLTETIADKLGKYAPEDIKPSVLEEILTGTENVPAKLLSGTGNTALQELHEVVLGIQEQAKGAAWEAFKADFETMKNVDLKKLAYNELDAHGYQKSLGSFLLKDEKIELLAKFKADAPVDDLVAKAKQTYLIKEGKAPAQIEKDVVSESVKAPEVKAAEAAADPAKPEFDLLKILDQSGEEHLAPAEPIKVELEPHPAAKVTHVFTSTGERPTGGSHPMEIFVDENGDKWLFKVQEQWQSEVEDWAAQMGEKLGLDVTELRIESEVQTTFYGTVDGSFQRMLPNVGELGKEGGSLGKLTEEQVKDLQRQQVYDWLISNHDSHGQNFLIGLDGHLVPIDKGQAMKFFGTDSLSTTYSPNHSAPAYNRLWEAVQRGEIKVDLNAIDQMLTRVEQLNSDEYRELLREKFAEKYATKMNVIKAYQSTDTRTLEEFIAKAVERKENIRADFEKFYKEIAKRANIDWTPSWAADVAKAEKIVEPATKLAAKGDIVTPVDSNFAKAIAETRSGGQALHLAGEEVNGGQALFWEETDVDGSKILRMEVRLESQADARVTATFEDAAGVPMGQVGNAVPISADPAFDVIQDAAKTVNHHVTKGDFEPNQQKIDAMLKTNQQLFDVIDKAAEADAKLAKGEIDAEQWAATKAAGDQAAHYKQIINDIQDGISYQHKVEHVGKFDLDKAKAEWMTKQPFVQPQPVLSEPEKLFTKVTRETERVDRTNSGAVYMERVRTGDIREIDVSASSAPSGEVKLTYGQQFTGTMKVGDDTLKTTWSSWNMTSNYTGKSKLTMELKGWDGTEAGVQRMLQALDKLGVDSHLATREEERLTYWQLTTGQMKNSVEYVQPQRASGAYKGMRATIDRIEARISAEALDTQGQIDVYREEWAKQFGQDAVDRATESISHIHDLQGREIGLGHFERFDLPPDLRPYMQKGGQQWGIARKAKLDKDVFTGSWGSTGNGEKIRLGASKAGTSAEADLATGGGTGSFASVGLTGWQSDGPMMVVNPSSVLRRASNYLADHDNFGRIADRGEESYLNPAEWQRYIGTGVGDNTREIVARNGYSFFDDAELWMARSEGEKDALVKTFNELGVTELRGIPIEDRVVISSNRGMAKIIDKWFSDHPDAYTHSYSAPVDLQPGAKAAAKAADVAAKPAFVTTAAKGSLKAQQEAYENAISDWSSSTNSVKAKLDDLASKLTAVGTKTSGTALKDEFGQWWADTGQYKGLSQVKATKSFMAFKAKETEVKAAVEGLAKAADKVEAMKTFSNTPAKQAVLEDVFGKPFPEIIQSFKTATSGASGAYGEPFNNWLIQEALKLDPVGAPTAVVGDVNFLGKGFIDKAGLEGIVNEVAPASSKIDAIAKQLNSDFEEISKAVSEKKDAYIASGLIEPGSLGQISQTLTQVLKELGTPAIEEGYKLGDLGVIPKSKIEELLTDTTSSASTKLLDIAKSLGKGEDMSTVLQGFLDAKAELGVTEASGTNDVLKAMLDSIKAAAPTPPAAEGATFVTVPVLGDLTSDVAKGLQALLDDAGYGEANALPLYTKDVANVLGLSQDTAQVVLDSAAKEYGLVGNGWDSVVHEWLHDAEQGGLKIESKVAEEIVPKIADVHPGFAAQAAPASSTGFAYDIMTPLGQITGDTMNDFTDAAWAIEHQGEGVVAALNQAGEKIGQTYADMLPNLDAYAKEKGLGGFPGPEGNPEAVLKAFVDDTSKAVSKAIHEPPEPVPTQAVHELLAPQNTAKPPLAYDLATLAEHVGSPVSAPSEAEKIFSYNVNGTKVPVVFAKTAGGTNVIVQEKGTGQWFLLKATHSGKTAKDEILHLLDQVGHSSVIPF